MRKNIIFRAGSFLFGKPASALSPVFKWQSYLLTAMVYALLLINLAIIIFLGVVEGGVFLENEEFIASLLGFVFLFVIMMINLAGKHNIAAFLLIITFSAFVILTALPVFDFHSLKNLFYLIFPIMLASVLLPIQGAFLIVICIGAGLTASIFTPIHIRYESIPIFYLSVFSVLAIFLAEHRRQVTKANYDQLLDSEQRLFNIVESAPETILVFDWEADRIIEANENAVSVFKVDMTTLTTFGLADLFDRFEATGKGFDEELKIMVENAALGGEPVLEWEFHDQAGERLFAEIRLVKMPHDEKLLIRCSLLDITDRKLVEEQTQFLATHDPITELPNNSLFEDRLIRALAFARRKKIFVGVLYIDLDNFQSVNEAFSQSIGDQYLKIIGERLRTLLRDSDTISRRGGDEFSIILEGIKNPEDIIPIADKILTITSEPVIFEDREVFITTSIGISLYPQNGDTYQVLLQNADTALMYAKNKGKNNYQFFSKELEARALERLSLRGQLKHALDRSEFCLEYQPQINADTGRVMGLEALLRWDHPEYGRISPDKFIPLAEETGLIVPIGEWVIQHVCRQCRDWKGLTERPVRVSINLAEAQLQRKNFVDLVDEAIKENELDPGMIELELTENIVFRNIEHSRELLLALKGLGVRLAIDDFGTGYSTLRLLAQFPFDVLKIDRSFAVGVSSDPKDRAIANGILQIAKGLDLEVIAEGVETAEQLSFYQKNDCLLIQGWFYSKAVPETEVPMTITKMFPYYY